MAELMKLAFIKSRNPGIPWNPGTLGTLTSLARIELPLSKVRVFVPIEHTIEITFNWK